jgi:serine protease Do
MTGDTKMKSQFQKWRSLPARRLALLATTALALSAGALFIAPSVIPDSYIAYAQNMARPVGFADIVERVKPAVIAVRVRMDAKPQTRTESPFPPGSEMDEFMRRFGMPNDMNPNAPRGRGYTTGQGSGFFISSDGFAVTNNHVVDKATNVQVTADDGKTYSAKVIGVDPRTDLALIKIDGGNFPFVKFSDKAPRIGDWVLAVGNPFGLGGTVTAGIVSARGRDIGSGPYDDFIQIDAPVNKGNSGGPTFDVEGNVIGVNTAIFSPTGGSVGIAFAIPADTVKSVVAQLKDKGSVIRGWIGVSVQPVTPEIADSLGLKKTEGALVAEPQQGGPAAKAGIEAGDIIMSVNGIAIKDSRDLAKRIGGMGPGSTVRLVVLHKGAEKTVALTLGELPNVRESRNEPAERDLRRRRDRDQDFRGGADREDRGDLRRDRRRDRDDRGGQPGDMPRLGLSLAPNESADGVVVAAVDPDSPAAEFGFKTGDVILDIGGKTVSTPADVSKALIDARSEGKRSVLMRIKSQDGTRFIAVPLGSA